MSSPKAFETGSEIGYQRHSDAALARVANSLPSRSTESRFPRVAFAVGGAACVIAALLCFGSCGGTQGGTPSPAGAPPDASPSALPSSEEAGCALSQSLELQPMFNGSDSVRYSGPPDAAVLAGSFATYVSFDATGTLLPGSGQSSQPIDPAHAVVCMTGFSATGGDMQPARCGVDKSGLLLHAVGSGAGAVGDPGLTGWGMNVGIDLRQNCQGVTTAAAAKGGSNGPCFFDARGWEGISFWARLGPGQSGIAALATVGDPQTTDQIGNGILLPDGGAAHDPNPATGNPYNDAICGNPPCVPNAGPQGCVANVMPRCLCDPYGKAVQLFDYWTFYAIPFSDLRQKGYGLPEPELDLAHILTFKLSLGKGDWDVYLDDVAFYRAKAQ